ncbi:MAG: translation elongation factor [Microcoleus sp.]
MSKGNETANDKAWKILFDTHEILEQLDKNGFFEIESKQINKQRESRLMAKFDHSVNLPKIFRENKLSILPISRSKYVIGKFETHLKVRYDSQLEAISFAPPQLESIDYKNLYSESSALHCAFNIGIINDLVEEETFYTVSGRMSTESFDFNIINSIPNKKPYPIKVENSQCEIDAGFESDKYFILIEAKKYAIEDFLIRQLYYPYRLWSKKMSKKVIPVLMTYSNDIFSFFIYEFRDEENYNSLNLIKQKNYMISPEEIQLSDVEQVFNSIKIIAEPADVPFPQADRFERVVDLLSLLLERDLTKDDITENYEFDRRQTDYYTNAGLYIGLIEKYQNYMTNKATFRLTSEGRSILHKRSKLKYLNLINKILEHEVFYLVFELAISQGELPSKDEICKIMSKTRLDINDTTKGRRYSTVRRWIFWIWSQIKD